MGKEDSHAEVEGKELFALKLRAVGWKSTVVYVSSDSPVGVKRMAGLEL